METEEKNSLEDLKRKKAVKWTVIILALVAFGIYVISVYQTLSQ